EGRCAERDDRAVDLLAGQGDQALGKIAPRFYPDQQRRLRGPEDHDQRLVEGFTGRVLRVWIPPAGYSGPPRRPRGSEDSTPNLHADLRREGSSVLRPRGYAEGQRP